MNIQTIEGILIPFLGTTLGAAMVFLLKNQISVTVQKALTGFAAGVMVAASFWSLLQPALDSSAHMGSLAFLPAAIGFLIGIGFLLGLDVLTPHMHMDKQNEGPQSGFKHTTKLILAVTLHNIPEGMAVGVVYAGLLAGASGITAAGGAGDRHSEFPRRRDCFHAPAGGRYAEAKDLPDGCSFRCGRTHRRSDHNPGRRSCHPRDALFPGFRCRRHDVCRCGGTDSRNVGRKAFKHRYHRFLPGFCPHDDPGCRPGINGCQVIEIKMRMNRSSVFPDTGQDPY